MAETEQVPNWWRARRHERFALAAEINPKGPWVYFMASGDGVKIGHSTNLRKRLAEIRVANPGPVLIVGLLEGKQKMETAFHRILRDDGFHVTGEWFRLDADMRFLIEGLCDG